jgi:lysophospholipase L1-like esterase
MVTFDTEPFALDYHKKRLAVFNDEQIVRDKIVFAGCSITEFGKWNELLNDMNIINRGIAGDNSFGLLNRIDDIINLQPSMLFISIGINDIAKDIPAEVTAANILELVKKLKESSPKTKILIHSILPTNASNRQNKYEVISHYNKNDKVVELNRIVEQNSQENDFIFIDLHSSFKDTNGDLNLELADKDGLHLNDNGYILWSDILKRKVLER